MPDAPPPPKLACGPGSTAKPAPAPEPTLLCVRADGTRHGPFVSTFPDGTVASTGTYADGVLDGAWQRNHPTGQVAELGTFLVGHKSGHWKQLSETGVVLGEYDIAAGTGTEKRWYDAGPLYSERSFVAGVEHGTSKIYAPDGSVLVSARFVRGKLDGPHQFGTRNTLRIEETFSGGVRTGKRTVWQFWLLLVEENYDAHGRYHGPYTMWRNKKTPRFKGDYEHGRKVGPWIWNDRDNNLEREGTYVAGKRDGVWTEYWEKKVTFTGTYAVGKPDGTFVYSDRNGNELGRFDIKDGTGTMLTYYGNRKVATREHVFKGTRDGAYQELTVRGKVILEGHYASDVRHGAWKEWTLDGVPLVESSYRRGKLDGTVRKFVDGKLSTESTYKDGKATGTYRELRPGPASAPRPAVTGQFVDDRRDGTWTQYDPTGSVVLVSTYKAGVLDGPWKQLVDGAVLEGTMTAGRRTGTWTRTDKGGAVQTLSYDVW
ncbi:MAG: hypothetical protein NT062_12830 [Proteobacteria bacterium]|nr:hypothetical protein [Pseudomonadota bacterium]